MRSVLLPAMRAELRKAHEASTKHSNAESGSGSNTSLSARAAALQAKMDAYELVEAVVLALRAGDPCTTGDVLRLYQELMDLRVFDAGD